MPRGRKKSTKKLGADPDVITPDMPIDAVVSEPAPDFLEAENVDVITEILEPIAEEPIPEVAETVLPPVFVEPPLEVKPDLMVTLVGAKRLYGKRVKTCELVDYYRLTDEDGSTFLKTKEELDEVLK